LIRKEPELGDLAVAQMVEVDYLRMKWLPCSDLSCRVSELYGEPVGRGYNVLDFEDGIRAMFVVPFEPINYIAEAQVCARW
jgi:hypothetical protein